MNLAKSNGLFGYTSANLLFGLVVSELCQASTTQLLRRLMPSHPICLHDHGMPVNGMLSGKGWFRDVRLRRASDALLLESLDVFSVLEFDGQRSATKFLSLSHHKLHLAQLRLSCAVVSFSKKPQLVDGSDPKGGFLIGFSLASPSGNGNRPSCNGRNHPSC